MTILENKSVTAIGAAINALPPARLNWRYALVVGLAGVVDYVFRFKRRLAGFNSFLR